MSKVEMTYKKIAGQSITNLTRLADLVGLVGLICGEIEKMSKREDFMNFVTWLKKQAGRDDPIGDLATDARHDPEFPRRVQHYQTIQFHLVRHHACEGALEALADAWREYAVTQSPEITIRLLAEVYPNAEDEDEEE